MVTFHPWRVYDYHPLPGLKPSKCLLRQIRKLLSSLLLTTLSRGITLVFEASGMVWNCQHFIELAVCQNLVPLVNIKIAGKWMLIPLKMVLIGIDPYPINIFQKTWRIETFLENTWNHSSQMKNKRWTTINRRLFSGKGWIWHLLMFQSHSNLLGVTF